MKKECNKHGKYKDNNCTECFVVELYNKNPIVFDRLAEI